MSASIVNTVKAVKPYAVIFRKSDGVIIKLMQISEINIYPIKSLKGISIDEGAIEDSGLQFDRRWMLVDGENRFMTQREHPKMATVKVSVNGIGLTVEADNAGPIFVPGAPESNGEVLETVTVWNSTVKAAVNSNEVNHWFSNVLNFECRLVTMTENTNRLVDPDYAVRPDRDTVSFADGYPFLLIGKSSLDDLNERLRQRSETDFLPLPMNRFRPSFVVSSAEPFAEDQWKVIRIGETVFHVVKPCGRCVITTIDQATGETNGDEPLKTLSAFRKQNGKVLFGQNLIAEKSGTTLRVGDDVEVLEFK